MRGVMLAGLLVIAGPASGQEGWKVVDDCYRKNVVDLDDMSSDAQTIANAVSFVCLSAERQYVRGTTGGGELQVTQAHIDMRSTFTARATTAVLVRRVMIRKGELKP